MKTILIILFFSVAYASTDETEYLFNKGNELYQAGKYSEAIEQYESALAAGYESSQLYYNLGNAYFKTRQIGKCILNYERAKKLHPRDKDVDFNLSMANLYVVDKIKIPEPNIIFKAISNFKNYYDINTVGWIVVTLYVITMLSIIIRVLIRKKIIQDISKMVFYPVLTVFIIALFTFFVKLYDVAKTTEAVIMTDKVAVLSSPAQDATELFALHEGVKVQIEDTSGDWFKISLADGKVGWITKTLVEKI